MIRFGTDGWRAIIGDEFTFDNVRVAAQATSDYFLSLGGRDRTIIVGHDVRFLSDRFARAAAEVFAGNGFRVLLLDRPCPTPYVSYEVRRRGLTGGVVITASHNPASYNGFKVKGAFGGSATGAMTAEIERLLGRRPVRRATEGIEFASPGTEYVDSLRRLIDWPRLAASGLRVTVDSMHGCGGRLLEDWLAETTCSVRTLRARPDPMFGGIAPEPMLPQLDPLVSAVRASGSHIGLATDGDADRLGVVAEDGRFVSSLEILPLLLIHLRRRRRWDGAVAHTFSQSRLVGLVAAAFGLEVFETPIGFKNIAELMLERTILIGGEESGGIGMSRHLPERDGVAVHLLLLDLLAETGKPLGSLIRDMWDEFGEFRYARRDMHLDEPTTARVRARLQDDPPRRIGERTVADIRTVDGVKLVLDDRSWILFRPSGTEPVLRVYVEAPTLEASRRLLDDGVEFVEQCRSTGV